MEDKGLNGSTLIAPSVAVNRTFLVQDQLYRCNGRPFIMGILNVTPDSFSDGGRYLDIETAVRHAQKMEAEGADFIDIGGESSRPGSQPISAEEEVARVLPIIQSLAAVISIPLSIDTIKAGVARAALAAGASMVNDISALHGDTEMAHIVADFEATIVLMHMQGEPRTMQENPHYHDLVGEIHAFLSERIDAALKVGIRSDRILVDPGLGFGKRFDDNFELLGRLREFTDLGPVLVGPSRKAFIGQALDLPVGDRLFGTAGAVAVAVTNGADVIRVHDVKPIVQIVKIVHQCVTRIESKTSRVIL